MAEKIGLFVRSTVIEELREPQLLRDTITQNGLTWSDAEREIADFYFRRPIRLTGDSPFLPSWLKNVRVRPFWRDLQSAPLLESDKTGFRRGHW